MKMENWAVVFTDHEYTAPELRVPKLGGNVYGHPRFEDGEEVVTSRIVSIENKKVLTESGSLYELGEINPNYEAMFPDAEKRLINQIVS